MSSQHSPRVVSCLALLFLAIAAGGCLEEVIDVVVTSPLSPGTYVGTLQRQTRYCPADGQCEDSESSAAWTITVNATGKVLFSGVPLSTGVSVYDANYGFTRTVETLTETDTSVTIVYSVSGTVNGKTIAGYITEVYTVAAENAIQYQAEWQLTATDGSTETDIDTAVLIKQ